MKTEIIKAEDFGIENTKAKELTKGLDTILAEKQAFIIQYTKLLEEEITEANIVLYRNLRFKIKDNRTKGINPWHKTNKAYFLAGGRFVDAIKNKENAENERMEETLLSCENHFSDLETARLLKESMEKEALLTKLQDERLEKIKPYLEDAYLMDLSGMEEDVFEAYLSTKKQAHLDAIKTLKEAAEKERLEAKAEKERLEAIEKDNTKLRKEAEEKEKLAKIESNKRDKIESDLKAKQDAELKAEREKTQKVASELKAKQDAELKEIEDVKEKNRLELLAPDKDKLRSFVRLMDITPPELDSKEAIKVREEIEIKFNGFRNWATQQVDKLN